MSDIANPQMVTRFEIAAPECVADDFGGEIVALNMNSGVYFSLRDLAANIWTDLAAGCPAAAILDVLRQHDDKLAADAKAFIDRLLSEGLMRAASLAPAQSGPVAVHAALASGTTVLTIQSYDDMKDLVMTDPIHDVADEFGWPALRTKD